MFSTSRSAGKRLKLIACEIAFREMCLVAAQSRNVVDLEFLTKGLHDIERADMQTRLQARVDAVDPDRYEAILLGYGRCSDGVVGLLARSIPLVIPRAHDCITFFLGSKECYRDYFDTHPGTYFRTSGWIEREFANEAQGVMAKLGLDKTYDEYVAEHGKENADFIWQSLASWQANYERLTFIETGVGIELRYAERVRTEAAERGWAYERLDGSLALLRRLFDGDWADDAFLLVPPGHTIASCNDERILDAVGPGGLTAGDSGQ